MAEILLYGGLLLLAGAVLFVIFRPVFSAVGDEANSDAPDFRPRDSSGKVIETFGNPQMPINPAHPSRRYLENIEARLRANGNDPDGLALPEKNFLLAHRFDQHLQNGGLVGFLSEYPERYQWEKAKDALFILRADEYHAIFSEFLDADGARAADAVHQGSLQKSMFSDDWDARLLNSRTGGTQAEKASYMERLLDFYCDEGDEG